MVSALISADALADYVNACRAIVDEAVIHLTDEGVETQAVDPANVAMVDVALDHAAFDSSEADGGRIGVNLERLDDVLGMADSGELVHLNLNPETRKLHIDVGGLNYTLALIDPDVVRREPDMPDLDWPAAITVEGGTLDQGRRAADLVANHVTLSADADTRTFAMTAEGDTDDVAITAGDDDLLDVRVENGASPTSLFSLEYLTDVLGPIDADTIVGVRLGEDLPARLQWAAEEGDLRVVSVIAPRIVGD